jgi:ribosomal protein S18 acetylase RimI-like enzyme
MSVADPQTDATVVKATAAQAGTVIDIIGQAFDDDPAVNWFVRRDQRRSAAVHAFFQMMADTLYLRHDENYLMSDGSGATMWLPPGISTQVGFAETFQQLPAVLRIVRFRGLRRLLRVQAIVEGNHPHEPHYYLFAIGTLPELRGRGIGSKLMRPMIERMDRERMPGYLENSKEQNLPFYERHGFEVTQRVQLPGGGPSLWLMWRKPR